MAGELRATDFDALGFAELDLREDPRCWSWALDRHMILFALSTISAVTLLLTVATGMMSFHQDPLDALARRSIGSTARLDTSWSVEFHIIPDRPLGIEFRKVGEDESIRLYEPGE